MSEADRGLLTGHLRQQRQHVLGILEGLSEEQLRRPVLPSGWSCADMLRHLVLDEERFWFRCVVAGEAGPIAELDDLAGTTWTARTDATAEQLLAEYRTEIERSDAVIAATALDAPPAWWPGELFGSWRLADLREVLLHMITEVACHAGHVDAVRELLDGRQWLVLTD